MEQAILTATTNTTGATSQNDALLLERVANGDKAAFETLYRGYYRRLSQFVYKLTPNLQLGEEIVDDTMLAVWKSAGGYAGRSKVSTWIFGIAYRRAMNTLGKEKKHRSVNPDDGQLELMEDTNAARDPVAVASATRMRREIDTGISKLNRNQQVALQLTALGHSYPEISAIMDCPAATVKTRVFKARRKLKTYMSDAGIGI